MNIFTSKRFSFCGSRQLWNPRWDEGHNQRVYGFRANPLGYGSNFILDVTVAGPVDAATGMNFNVRELKEIVDRVIVEFDHRHFNQETTYFQAIAPTDEHLARVLA